MWFGDVPHAAVIQKMALHTGSNMAIPHPCFHLSHETVPQSPNWPFHPGGPAVNHGPQTELRTQPTKMKGKKHLPRPTRPSGRDVFDVHRGAHGRIRQDTCQATYRCVSAGSEAAHFGLQQTWACRNCGNLDVILMSLKYLDVFGWFWRGFKF